MQKMMISVLIAGALALISWPVVDDPVNPALEFVDVKKNDWTGQRAAWVGDQNKRDAILMSAVWQASVHKPNTAIFLE